MLALRWISIGSRVIDIGCGPGYATLDLAEIVGRTGEVFAIERSERFLKNRAGPLRGEWPD